MLPLSLSKKQMNPVMDNIPYLKHVALERRPVGTVPNSTNVLSQGAMASGFSSRSDETLKGF